MPQAISGVSALVSADSPGRVLILCHPLGAKLNVLDRMCFYLCVQEPALSRLPGNLGHTF